MTEDKKHGEEGFLNRWSRLKQQQADDTPAEDAEEQKGQVTALQEGRSGALPASVPSAESQPSGERASGDGDTVPVEDLPSIDSIDATTDLTPWLKKKLPPEWKQAALRRMWAVDAEIANFVGPADYAWDWNVPDGVPGFGPIRELDNIAALVAQAIGSVEAQPKKEAETRETQVAMDAGKHQPIEDAAADCPDAAEIEDAQMSADLQAEDDAQKSANENNLLDPPPHLPRRGGGALPV